MAQAAAVSMTPTAASDVFENQRLELLADYRQFFEP